MKRITNILRQTLLLATLAVSGVSFATDCNKYGFFETDNGYVWEVGFGYNSKQWVQHGDRSSNYSGDLAIGKLTTDLVLQYFKTKCWGASAARRVHVYRKIDSGAFTETNPDTFHDDSQSCGDKVTVHASAINRTIMTFSTAVPGNHTLEYYIQLTCSSGTAENNYCHAGNTTSNMKVTYTIPGFSNTTTSTLDFGNTNKGAAPEKKSTFTHYGSVPSKPTIADYTGTLGVNEVSDPTAFEVTKIDNSGITFKFKTSGKTIGTTYYAQVTITDSDARASYNSKTIVVKGTVITPQPEVRIAEEAIVSDGPHTTFSGYVKYTGCYTIDKVGFVYGTSANPTISNSHLDITPSDLGVSKIEQGQLFSKTAYNLTKNTTYHYRAYIHSTTAVGGYNYFYSEDKTFTAGSTCDFSTIGDTVYYTIDASKEADWCSLRFPSLAEAVADMKTSNRGHSAWMNNTSGDANYHCLTKPVVFEVVSGTYGNSDNSTRDTSLEDLNTKSVSTYTPTPTKPDYRLIIRAKDPSKKMPVFKGGLSLMKARYITFKDIEITRNSSTSAHDGAAVELGVYPSGDAANACVPGTFANADIEFVHCKIDATGFNCIHAAGCGGLKFDQCEFKMNKPTYATDAANKNCRSWGGSVKLMSCKNVQFTRNSLKGSHATTLFLQYVQDMLVMNNVFWNDNQYTENVAFVRPVVLNYAGHTPPAKNTNIGIYYNTFYLADADASSYRVDFLRFGCYDNVYDENGTASTVQRGNTSYYDQANMYFKYNNCYSYDDQISQRSGDSSNGYAFQSVSLTTNNYTPNNFWSEGDGANKDNTGVKCGMAFPTAANVNTAGGDGTVQHINVKHIVCQSTADNPDDLVVSGDNLNIGNVPSSSAVAVLNEATLTLADRFDEIARPENGTGWTYGAFQQQLAPDALHVIYWAGSENEKWDIRGNWRTEEGKRVSCVHSFATDLKVVIPDGTLYSPLIPAWCEHDVNEDDEATNATTISTRGKYPKEFVEAGRTPGSLAKEASITKYADKFELKHGATIMGVENLYSYPAETPVLRYSEGHNIFMVPRSKWVLISSIIKPWDSDGPQNVRGVDLYMDGVPQVYLRDVAIDDKGNATWNKSYESLWTELPADKGFAIRIPDQYGPTRLTAEEYYNKYPDATNKIMADDSIKYDFYGRFYNESALPSYSVTASTKKVVSNTYPANINATSLKAYLKDKAYGSLLVYDRNNVSFRSSQAGDTIRAQQAYIIIPASTGTLDIPSGVFVSGTAKENYLKSSDAELPFVSIDAVNLYAQAGSNILVTLDELKDNSYNLLYDDEKLFNNMEIDLPEVYIMEYDKKLCSVTLPAFEHEIPLGLRVLKKMYVRFKLRNQSGIDQAEIVDRDREMSVDIIDGVTYYTVELNPGTYEGRFFLNLGVSDSGDAPVITDVDASEADSGISIYSDGSEITVSSNSSVNLETLHVTNMAGVTRILPLKDAHYNRITLGEGAGVYVVKALGDIASRTEKVIVK